MWFCSFDREQDFLLVKRGFVLAILLMGLVGTGKTTCMKHWASEWAESRCDQWNDPSRCTLPEDIDLMIYIDRTHECWNWKDTFFKAVNGSRNEKIEAWTRLQNRDRSIALFVDGIDEFKHIQNIKEIFSLQCVCHLVISCRSNHPVLKDREHFFKHKVKVHGINPEGIKQYIGKYLAVMGANEDTAEALYSKLDKEDMSFWAIPLNCLFLCDKCPEANYDRISLRDQALRREHQTYLLERECAKFPLGFWLHPWIWFLKDRLLWYWAILAVLALNFCYLIIRLSNGISNIKMGKRMLLKINNKNEK